MSALCLLVGRRNGSPLTYQSAPIWSNNIMNQFLILTNDVLTLICMMEDKCTGKGSLKCRWGRWLVECDHSSSHLQLPRESLCQTGVTKIQKAQSTLNRSSILIITAWLMQTCFVKPCTRPRKCPLQLSLLLLRFPSPKMKMSHLALRFEHGLFERHVSLT